MIVAVVLLALVASSQVQAFPGSEPAFEALSLLSRSVEGADMSCVLSYKDRALEVVRDAEAVVAANSGPTAELLQKLAACLKDADDKRTCALQAVRSSWEDTAALREGLRSVGFEAVALGAEIHAKCFCQ